MNVRTGLKTLAVAVPMTIAPMKSTAQNVTKEVAKAPIEYKARLGLGYGRTAYFDQMHYEPKIVAEIGSRNDKAVAELDALVGKSNQEFKAFVGMPVKSGKAGYITRLEAFVDLMRRKKRRVEIENKNNIKKIENEEIL